MLPNTRISGYTLPRMILLYSPLHYITLELKPCVCMYQKMFKKCESTNECYSKRNSINASNLESNTGKSIWLSMRKTLKATFLIQLYISRDIFSKLMLGNLQKLQIIHP